jgi:hypothetical protein
MADPLIGFGTQVSDGSKVPPGMLALMVLVYVVIRISPALWRDLWRVKRWYSARKFRG